MTTGSSHPQDTSNGLDQNLQQRNHDSWAHHNMSHPLMAHNNDIANKTPPQKPCHIVQHAAAI